MAAQTMPLFEMRPSPAPTRADVLKSKPSSDIQANEELSQWFTPEWAAIALVERYFPSLSSCGLPMTAGDHRDCPIELLPCPKHLTASPGGPERDTLPDP